MKLERVLVAIKLTPYARLMKSTHPNDARLRRLLKDRESTLVGMKLAHEEHQASVRQVRHDLKLRGIAFSERHQLLRRPVRGYDLVLTVGGDGTLLEASHAVRDATPILGVNSAPASSVGFLTGCRAPTFAGTLDALSTGRIAPIPVVRLAIEIGAKTVAEPVLNDVLFCHDNPAVTTRYRLHTPTDEEVQRSSGLWIATPAGSTAALRSAGGTPLPLVSDHFAFVVREPYAPPGSSVRIAAGTLGPQERLMVGNQTDEASIYIDGSHRRHAVPFGEELCFRRHEQPLMLVRPATRL